MLSYHYLSSPEGLRLDPITVEKKRGT